MLPPNDLFTAENQAAILNFHRTYEPIQDMLASWTLPPQHVKTLFYGDSITAGFRFQEFIPGRSLLNRGIPGDNLDGLYARLDRDLLPYTPDQVVLLAGINGIGEPNERMLEKFAAIGKLITQAGCRLYLCSVLPLRHGDKWDRFQYQAKIVELNAALKAMAEAEYAGFVDYHAAVRDAAGELAEPYAKPDGTHITFAGYRAMAQVLTAKVRLD